VLSPHISISLGARVKAPGEVMKGTDVELTLHERPGSAELAPYERLLGDPSLFARADAVEAAWAVVEPILGDVVLLRATSRKPGGRNRPGTSWHDTATGATQPRAGQDVTSQRQPDSPRHPAFLERLVHADFSTCGKLCTHRNTIAALLALWFYQRTVADLAAAFRRNLGAMGAPELEEQRVSRHLPP
jgi:hypothetical protein